VLHHATGKVALGFAAIGTAIPAIALLIDAKSMASLSASDATLPGSSASRPLLDTLPPAMAEMVRSGSNRQDLAPYINRAIARGGTFDLGGFTYRINGRLIPGPGTVFSGNGTFLADPAFDDHAQGDGLAMMLQIVDGLKVGSGITFDGGSIRRPAFWLTGARNTGPVHDVVLDGTYRNLSFDGIDISRNNGAWRNARITTHAHIENVGWIGANLEGVDGLVHDGLQVFRTGFHGIYVGYSHDVRGDRFRVDKSRPPYRVYDGSGGFGGQEKGFLFGHFSTAHARWTHFNLFDNRAAGYDGFGIGEDGPLADPESQDIVAQGDIWYPGLFGLDVSSNMTADVAVHYPTHQGVHFGLDLGGTLSNITVNAIIEGNPLDEAARFSATGSAIRKVALQAGSTAGKVIGNGDFTVVPGQTAIGQGIVPGTRVTAVANDHITLDRPATGTFTQANPTVITFRASVAFKNCTLILKVAGADYGLGIQSDVDGFTRYSNVRVLGNFSGARRGSIRRLNGRLPTGLSVEVRAKPKRTADLHRAVRLDPRPLAFRHDG